ncbi:stage II sporulation protein [Salipaludibacillus keqinensis]|jgi:stage II sporulation protein Q|uniref:Stage II sporulation protein n=1 Tax=Salipaludibacillus keqinensis TaxID=2045207 RepID=A0A323TD14_9BACI|nr:M23 family metallopeptidase [Salipaludibacillus keqinensis]PYZ92516.1 stage II sporulation protein [Salipaludibacillus keqinensis]
MSNHEEKRASKREQMQAKMKRLMKQRWTMPALYLTLSAVVLTTFLWMASTEDLTEPERESEFDIEDLVDGVGTNQGNNDDDNSTGTEEAAEEDAVPAVSHDEVFELPVVEENEVAVVGTFHDYEASVEEQTQALIRYNNYFYQNKGIDLATDDGEPFDVTAAMSGTVVKAEEDALFGQVVHVEHAEDTLTIYQSLDGVKVEPGQTVKQGDVLGQAGRNLYNKDAGVHAHFEIRKGNVPVNPLDYMEQPVASLPDFSDDEQSEQQDPEEVPDPEEDSGQERQES